MLANMTLDGLESALLTEFGKKNSEPARIHKVNLVRYADDFIITGASQELLEKKVIPLVEQFLAKRGLSQQCPVRFLHGGHGETTRKKFHPGDTFSLTSSL